MVRVRNLTEQEAPRLQRIVRRGGGTQSVVTWRRAMVVLASAQGHSVPVIPRMVQTSEDRGRGMIRNFDEGGMESLHPRWSEGRPATFIPKVRARIIRIAIQRPEKFGLPFTAWSVAKLQDYLIKRRVVPSISTARLRQILAEEGISFQKTKTWKESPDPDKEAKLARIEQVTRDHPDRVVAFDEFGPLPSSRCGEQPGHLAASRSACPPTTASSTASATSWRPTTSGASSCWVASCRARGRRPPSRL